MPRNPLDRLLERLPHRARVLADWLIGIAIAVVIVLAARAWIATPYAIPTPSMEPTLRCARSGNPELSTPGSSVQPGQAPSAPGANKADVATYQCQGRFADRVLVNRFIYRFRSPRRGEVVVFKPPYIASKTCTDLNTDVLVKRLIGLPGDVVIERSGVIYVNGKKLDEPYVKNNRRDSLNGVWQIGKSEYFFMGDNRKASCDSRRWGTVPRKYLVGPVFMTYWPPNRISFR